MDTAPPSPPPEAAGPAAKPRPRRLWWLMLGGGLLLALLVVLPAVIIGLVWTSEPPLAWLLARVPGLTVDGLRGTLRQGDLMIRRLDWRLPDGARLRIDELRLDGLAWQAPYAMSLRAASAARVQFDSAPPPAAPSPPPAQLRLPISVRVGELRAQTVQINQLAPMQAVQGTLWLGANGGAQHRVELQSMQWQSTQLAGRLQIGTGGELALQAQLQAASVAGPRPWSAQARAQGPLRRLEVEAALAGQAPAGGSAPSLQAKATVAPFAPWPLAALTLSTRQLDLAALAPGLPTTQIDGSADVATSGLDQPASARIQLTNRLPGRHDEGRLPARALTLLLEGEPKRPDRLTLRRFDLQLADADRSAGSAGGSGRWADGRLDLQVELDGLQPARLDQRAAPLLIGGPLTLRVDGLAAPGAAAASAPFRLALQGKLAGRSLDGSGLPVRVQLDLDGDGQTWTLRDASAQAGTAQARLTGEARREDTAWRIGADARLQGFDPLPWWRGSEGTAWRRGPHQLNAQLKARLLWRDAVAAPTGSARWPAALSGEVEAQVGPSRLAGVPLSGRLSARLVASGAHVDTSFDLAGNQFAVQADAAPDGTPLRWQLRAQAPALAAMAPLMTLAGELMPAAAGWLPSAGQLNGEARGEGRWPELQTSGQLQLRGLRSREATLADADLRWERGGGTDPRLLLQLNARGLVRAGQSLDRIEARVEGRLSDHRLSLSADSPARPPAWAEPLLGPAGTGSRFAAEGRGAWTTDGRGHRWTLAGMRVQGGAREGGGSRSWLSATELGASASFGPGGELQSLQLAPGRLQLLTTGLRWREAEWRAGATASTPGRFALSAELESFDVAALLQRLQPGFGWSGNLTVGGRVEMHHAGRFDADIVLERGGGDLGVTDELGQTQVLGLTDLRLAFSAHDGVWQFAQGLAGRQIGEMAGAQVVRTAPDRNWPAPDAPLQGVLQMRVANLGIWSPWVPPGWRLGGSLVTSASIDGRFSAPELRGEMRGSGLAVRNLLQGINVSDGELAITLQGERAQIERFVFRGGDGRLTLTGGAALGADPSARLTLAAEHFRLLGRIDRRIVTTGRAELALDRSSLQLDGRFRIDDGLIDVSRADAPTLDSDVRIVVPAQAPASANGAARPPAAASAPSAAASGNGNGRQRDAAATPGPLRNARVDVAVDLGDRLRLRGRGIDTGLRGELRITSPGGRLALSGSVRTEGGTYAAYGQKLEITRGVLHFTGDAGNPRLDVLAVRPNLDVVVGVSVAGTAASPRIRLTSEPEMPEMDKLSWLVLGRSPDGLGRTDTALLQRAAIALLAGEGGSPTDDLVNRLGLTDFSVRQTEGDVRETIVSLGRQLSRRWYVGYERSVNSTSGTWQLIYRVAQRFTLRAQSGGENSVDVIWSWRW